MEKKIQVIRSSMKISAFTYFVGLGLFAWFQGWESALWFGIGGGMALFNYFLAMIFVRIGLSRVRYSAPFLSILLLKSLAFVGIVALVLMFSKPLFLPFTLGIGLVIFGAIIWAVLESRQYFRKEVKES